MCSRSVHVHWKDLIKYQYQTDSVSNGIDGGTGGDFIFTYIYIFFTSLIYICILPITSDIYVRYPYRCKMDTNTVESL